MCTSIALPELGLFGRNLDLEYHFGERVVVSPRGCRFPLNLEAGPDRGYAVVGTASVADGVPLWAEAANEKGLYIAGLYFPGNAVYHQEPSGQGRLPVAPYELIPLLLSRCATLAEARELLERVQLVARPFGPGYPLAPLHWQIAGPEGSLVAEPMEDGLHIYEDRVGVLTNNPPYPYQVMNLNNYRALSPATSPNTFDPEMDLSVYGQGLGGLGQGKAAKTPRFMLEN